MWFSINKCFSLKKNILTSGELRTLENQVAYNKQRNFCTRLLKKEKQNYFEYFQKLLTMFWRTVKPMVFDIESMFFP